MRLDASLRFPGPYLLGLGLSSAAAFGATLVRGLLYGVALTTH